MSFRKWIVRSVVVLVLACCLGAGVVYQQWTNPTAVRQQVVDMLQRQFPGASITLDGAHLRLLGGVVLSELRLLSKDDEDAGDFLHIPQATVHLNKEKLLDGKFAVSRIELLRPHVRIARGKDGAWNLRGLTGDAPADGPLPTIVIQEGTFTFEDEYAGGAVWEVRDISLKLIQDAPGSLSFSGGGRSEPLGNIEARGAWNRRSNAAAVSLHVNGLSLSKNIVDYALSLHPDERLKYLRLEGKADIAGEVTYQPDATPSLQPKLHCVLRQVSVDHPRLPVALHNLSASLRCDAGKLTLERLKAAAASGKIECEGWADLDDPENTFHGVVVAHHLPVTKDLVDRLPAPMPRLFDLFNPVGRAKGQFVAEKRNGVWTRKYCSLEPDNATICFEKFPYPLERVNGFVDYDYLAKISRFDAIGYSGDHPVTVQGVWKGGTGLDADARIDITGKDIPLDDKLFQALKPALREQARAFQPSGKAQFYGVVRRTPGSLDFQNAYYMHFVDCKVLWKEFPYPLENVSGDLVVSPNETYEFVNFHGNRNGGDVFVNGKRTPRTDAGESKVSVNITGRELCLDADLRRALGRFEGLGKTWDAFSPAGRLSFEAEIEQVPNQPHDMDIGVQVAGCTIEPSFFPYALHDVCGQFRYRKNKVELTQFTARHNVSQLSIANGTIDVFPGGGFYAELDDLVGHVLADDDFLNALPQKLRGAATTLNLRNQNVHLQTKFIVSRTPDPTKHPEIWWDGQAWVRDAALKAGIPLERVTGTVHCRGLFNGIRLAGLCGNVYLNEATIYKQPFRDARLRFFVPENSPDVMWLNMNSPLFGGDVSGQGRLELSSMMRYELDLTASQIQLDQFGRHNLGADHQLAGIGAARLHLQGQGESLANLEGNGNIDVPYSPMTRLLNLPLLLDLLKFLGLRLPDRTMFEEAHANFAIHGNRVAISKLDLLGNVISLYGKGAVNLDGSDLILDMYPSWGRAEQVLPASVRFIPSSISKQLLKIEMRGKIGGNEGDLQFHQRYVPGIMDPLMRTLPRGMWGARQ